MAIDYDPVKAHEYYEKHKKLKGRKKGTGQKRKSRTTKGWSQEQKEQWYYVKDQLKTEHKGINKSITDSAKQRRKELSEATKTAIAELRERLKAMPKEIKAQFKAQIKQMCDALRAALKAKKQDLTNATKYKRAKEKTDYESRVDEAYNKVRDSVKKQKEAEKKKK